MPPRNYHELQASKYDENPSTEDGVVLSATPKPYDRAIVWRSVYYIVFIHVCALIGVICIPKAKFVTLVFAFVLYIFSGFGITAGAHRLWSHRSYKARLPLRVFLTFLQTLAGQDSIFTWSRDHRSHHKFCDTDADPYNIKRGIFFAHMGWLMVKKHPQVAEKGKSLVLTDLYADPLVRFQHIYYRPLFYAICLGFPTLTPLLWGEKLIYAFLIPCILRYVVTLHCTWCVNSVAHVYGMKPYDKRMTAVENLIVSIGAVGEGFHNFHHVFPSDYSTSEYGFRYFNFTTGFIKSMAAIGLAYDLKKTDEETVRKRRMRTGDLSCSY